MNSKTNEYIQKLLSFGVILKDSWIDQIKFGKFQSFEEFFKEFLFTDIEQTTEPDSFLIENFQKPHYCITKPITVQIDEIVDVSISDKERLHINKSQNPTLKALINSGGFRIAGVLHDQVQNLDLDIEPGIKILIKSGAYLNYGVLLIYEDNVVVLGGNSPQLIEKRDQMIKSQFKTSAFQNIEELYDVIPETDFGFNPSYIFHDLISKRNSKTTKTVLQAPLQNIEQPEPKKEEISETVPKPKIELISKPKIESIIKHSTLSEANSNMPAFKPTKQLKNSNTKHNILPQSNHQLKQNQIQNPNQLQKSNQTPESSISSLDQTTDSSTDKSKIYELGQLLYLPRSQSESLRFVNAHIDCLSINNFGTFGREKKKISPFICTLESNTSRQKIKISIDPLFLQLLFNLDYIDNLSQEDLIGTMRICEKKIKDMLSPPLSVIDLGKGRPYDRFLLTK